MKRFIAIVAMTLLLPFTAFGLTPMQDDQMNDITGQAGVSIAADVRIGLDIDTVAWGDADGIGGTSTGGFVGLSDVNASLFYGLRTDAGTTFDITAVEVLTIDVATQAPVLDANGDVTDPGLYNGASFVRIGLGTFELSGNIDFDIELGNTAGLGQELKTLDILGLQVRGGAGSYVDITTQGRTSGVTLALNVILDEVNIGSLAWGDSDGIDHIDGYTSLLGGNALSSAGYSGLANVDIDDVTITGALSIDTATFTGANLTNIAAITPTTNGELVLAKLGGYMATNPGEISSTLVILSLGDANGTLDATAGDLNINIGNMTADSVIGSDNAFVEVDPVTGVQSLTAGTSVMGTIAIVNANVTVEGIVAIGAH